MMNLTLCNHKLYTYLYTVYHTYDNENTNANTYKSTCVMHV